MPHDAHLRPVPTMSIRNTVRDATTIVLVLCAVVMTGAVVRQQVRRPNDPMENRRIQRGDLLARDGHRRGGSSAEVTIVEFADFQCPSCALARHSIDSVLASHPAQVALVFRHYPLRMTHPFALDAANAAECAGAQGKFFEMSEVLYSGQWQFGQRAWSSYAAEAGVADTARFGACQDAKEFARQIERDATVADSINILGTPTIIVNNKMLVGAVSTLALEREIKEAQLAARK